MTSQTKKPLSVHVGLAVAELICLSAFTIELTRALSGNALSWAYVFEWPILGAYAVYMWRTLLNDDVTKPTKAANAEASGAALDAYNAYLAQVHELPASEPPDHPTNHL